MADLLKISPILDFDNTDIQAFLDINHGYEKSGQIVQNGEYGVVLIKNTPEPLLLTNTSYYCAQSHFGKPDLYHSHPTIDSVPFDKYKAVNSKINKSNALKYDFQQAINGSSVHMEGEIPSDHDLETLKRLQLFLIFAANGAQPKITEEQPQISVNTSLNTPAQNTTSVTIDRLSPLGETIDRTLGIERQLEILLSKYGSVVARDTLLVGSASYNKKIQKAISAYATLVQTEKPLIMEDFTIFGSAKEGFVLTTENIYQKDTFEPKLVFPIHDICNFQVEFASKDLYYVKCVTQTKAFKFSTRSSEADAKTVAEFYKDALILVKEYKGGMKQNNANQSVAEPALNNQWLCECGKISTDNFCPVCGKSRATGKPLWTCSCGSVNKGMFCTKCGSPRKED